MSPVIHIDCNVFRDISLKAIGALIELERLDDIKTAQCDIKAKIFQQSCVFDSSGIKRDLLAESLLPDDLPVTQDRQLFPAKTVGNGDCLYNAVSISLRGMFVILSYQTF